MTEQSNYIPRRLSWTDTDSKPHMVEDSQLFEKFSQPMVILGDPGLGKTWLMERLGSNEECQFIRATSFLRPAFSVISIDTTLIIDGLDEVAAVEEGDPLHNVLKKLHACGKPRFVISCRSAEWRSVTGKLDIADDYGETPQELTLQPLSQEDAISVISKKIGTKKAKQVIDRLDKDDLSDLYKNPLTLDFVITILGAEGKIPKTRVALYESAVVQLRLERNDRHSSSTLARLSEGQALDAAGAVIATMLITGQEGIQHLRRAKVH